MTFLLNSFVFYLYLLRNSLKSSISLKHTFFFESILMVANNLIFFSIWWLFFQKFDEIAGWKMKDIVALMAIGSAAYGLMQICCGGVNYISRYILDGDLDPFMTQPKNLLINLIGSKSFSRGWGHLMTAIILIPLGGLAGWLNIPLILISILSGCLVFTSMGIIAHSLAFWLGSIEHLAQKYCESLYLFALYPTNIYSGLLQIIMFTLIPAGIISYIPIELLRNFSFVKLAILLITPILLFAFAAFIFQQGLKRYESGNKFGMRL